MGTAELSRSIFVRRSALVPQFYKGFYSLFIYLFFTNIYLSEFRVDKCLNVREKVPELRPFSGKQRIWILTKEPLQTFQSQWHKPKKMKGRKTRPSLFVHVLVRGTGVEHNRQGSQPLHFLAFFSSSGKVLILKVVVLAPSEDLQSAGCCVNVKSSGSRRFFV